MGLDLDKIADDLGLPRDKFREGVQRIQREQMAVGFRDRIKTLESMIQDGYVEDRLSWDVAVAIDRRYSEWLSFPPATPSAVPDGWRLVPKELTPEMASAMNEATFFDGLNSMHIRWSAALSAAPAPAGEKHQCTCDEHGACANCWEGRTGKPAGEKNDAMENWEGMP